MEIEDRAGLEAKLNALLALADDLPESGEVDASSGGGLEAVEAKLERTLELLRERQAGAEPGAGAGFGLVAKLERLLERVRSHREGGAAIGEPGEPAADAGASPEEGAGSSVEAKLDRIEALLEERLVPPAVAPPQEAPAPAPAPRSDGLGPRLERLLHRAYDRVGGDRRRVLYLPALGFESRLERSTALVLGGVASPRFLRSEPDREVFYEQRIPFALTLSRPRILVAESLEVDPGRWRPFLEAAVNRNAQLLVVTKDAESAVDVMRMLLVNMEDGTLRVGVVEPAPTSGSLQLLANTLGRAAGTPAPYVREGLVPKADTLERLPTGITAFLRRDTTIVQLPEGKGRWEPPDEDEGWAPLIEEIIVLRVGGRDVDDQQTRLWEVGNRISQRADEEEAG